LTASSSYIFERHDLARVDVCLLFAYTRWRNLAHAYAAYQLRDGIVVVAVAVVQLERGALFDVWRWRRVCYFCGCNCAEWEHGCGFGLCCGLAVAGLERRLLCGSCRWWRWQWRRWWWWCILLFSNSTVVPSTAT
jgi:hypothetical protein